MDKNKIMQQCTTAADVMMLAIQAEQFKNRLLMLKGRAKIDESDKLLLMIGEYNDMLLGWLENRFHFPESMEDEFAKISDPIEAFLTDGRKKYIEMFYNQYKKKK
jgi:hypothetical protein